MPDNIIDVVGQLPSADNLKGCRHFFKYGNYMCTYSCRTLLYIFIYLSYKFYFYFIVADNILDVVGYI